MEDFGCPRCKTTKYRVPSLKLMVNVCGHALCDSCIEILFVKGSATCQECGVILRRGNFRLQLFENGDVEKEVDIRRRVLKDFNKQETDFASLREYNDYLEEVENIIFNLTNNIDQLETNRKIEQYKKDNREQIAKGKIRPRQTLLELEEILEEEKLRSEQLQLQSVTFEKEEKVRKRKNREALIDDLMFSDTDAKSIVEMHKTTEAAAVAAAAAAASKSTTLDSLSISIAAPLTAASSTTANLFQVPGRSHFSSGIQIGRQVTAGGFLPVPKVEEVLYQYEEPHNDFGGPVIPSVESLTGLNSVYLKFIKAAAVSERAGGFHSKIACRRALQDAFTDIAFKPTLSSERYQQSTS